MACACARAIFVLMIADVRLAALPGRLGPEFPCPRTLGWPKLREVEVGPGTVLAGRIMQPLARERPFSGVKGEDGRINS